MFFGTRRAFLLEATFRIVSEKKSRALSDTDSEGYDQPNGGPVNSQREGVVASNRVGASFRRDGSAIKLVAAARPFYAWI